MINDALQETEIKKEVRFKSQRNENDIKNSKKVINTEDKQRRTNIQVYRSLGWWEENQSKRKDYIEKNLKIKKIFESIY